MTFSDFQKQSVTETRPALSERKFSVPEAAAHLGISKSFLDKARTAGTGPHFLKLGRRVVYDRKDLESWASGNRRRHTSV